MQSDPDFYPGFLVKSKAGIDFYKIYLLKH